MFRKCGHIFLAGDGEAASQTASFLGMAPPPKNHNPTLLSKTDSSPLSSSESATGEGEREGEGEATSAQPKLTYKQKKKQEAEQAKAAELLRQKSERGPLKRGEVRAGGRAGNMCI